MLSKERLLVAARGEPVDRLPWAPRIDMWFKAHARRGTVPPLYARATMWDIIRDARGDVYYNSGPVFAEVLHGVEVEEHLIPLEPDRPASGSTALAQGQVRLELPPRERRIAWHTPVGTVTQRFLFGLEMAYAGATNPFHAEYPIKGPADYRVIEYIIERSEIVPQHAAYLACQAEIGPDAVIFGTTGFSPFQRMMYNLLGSERTIFELHDHPELVDHLHAVLYEKYEEVRRVAAASPAEIVQIDANWNTLISPRIFKRYLLPYLSGFAEQLHAAGKLASAHCDGEMSHLFNLHMQTGLDVVEALTPAPMCRFTLAQAVEVYRGRKTIWGGLPAVIFSAGYPQDEFVAYLAEAGRLAAGGGRLVLSMGDNLPVDADLGRLAWISAWTADR